MKILRIYPYIHPIPGGLEKHVTKLTEQQIASGVDVKLYYSYGNGEAEYSIKVKPIFPLEKLKPQFLKDLIFYFSIILKLIVTREEANVVHIHGDWSAFLWAKVIKRIVNAQLVLGSFHGRSSSHRIRRYRFGCEQLNFLYCTGFDDVQKFSKWLSIPVYWQCSGIDECFFSSPDTKEKLFDVITVGSCVKIKNHKLFLDIAKELPNKKFALVGSGDLLGSYKNYCILNQIKNVTFLGSMESKDIAITLSKSHIFLMTSYQEGTPTAMMEAITRNNYVITSESNNYEMFFSQRFAGKILKTFDVNEYVSEINEFFLSSPIVNNNALEFSWKNVENRITALIKHHLTTQNNNSEAR
jgi:glycosyltransferase involved in cell wall biosynthesis